MPFGGLGSQRQASLFLTLFAGDFDGASGMDPSAALFLFWRAAALAALIRPCIGRSGVSCAQFPLLVPQGEKHVGVSDRINTLIQIYLQPSWLLSFGERSDPLQSGCEEKSDNGRDSVEGQ
jgi:hypothetical protein